MAACMYSTLLLGKHLLRMGVEMKKFIVLFPSTEVIDQTFGKKLVTFAIFTA